MNEIPVKNGNFRQDERLNTLRKNRLACTVITTNGVRVHGTLEAFDSYVILVRGHSGKQSMIYKHAISTIVADAAPQTDRP